MSSFFLFSSSARFGLVCLLVAVGFGLGGWVGEGRDGGVGPCQHATHVAEVVC